MGLVSGGPAASDPLLRDFATCAGRYSALVEHQWMVDGPASEASAEIRDSLLALVTAVQPDGMEAAALGWRIEAKAGQAQLLSRAYFARDSLAWARATELLRACAALIGQS